MTNGIDFKSFEALKIASHLKTNGITKTTNYQTRLVGNIEVDHGATDLLIIVGLLHSLTVSQH